MNKRKNPYTSLLEDVKSLVRKMKYAHVVTMFSWASDKLNSQNSWRLDEVYQRTLAAKSIGYEVVVEADEKGMTMKYRKVTPIPYQFE